MTRTISTALLLLALSHAASSPPVNSKREDPGLNESADNLVAHDASFRDAFFGPRSGWGGKIKSKSLEVKELAHWVVPLYSRVDILVAAIRVESARSRRLE